MFCGAKLFNQPLASWDVSKVFTMYAMFKEAKCFNRPLESWNVSNVLEMEIMFEQAVSFNQPLNKWNIAKLQCIYNAFSFDRRNFAMIGSEHIFMCPDRPNKPTVAL